MNFSRVSDNAGLFRHCIYPNAFKGKSFLPEKFWHLVKMNDGAFYGSLAWDRYLPRIPDVHAYGCELASRMNVKKIKSGILKPRDRLFYCGAYNIRGRSVRALARTPGLSEVTAADVFHLIENGQIAHVALKISILPNDPYVQGTKTAIVDRLWNSCSGPLGHTCAYDQDVVTHPSVGLPDGPAGPFAERKNAYVRAFCVLMSRVLTWLWRNSIVEGSTSSDSAKSVTRTLYVVRHRLCRFLWGFVGPTED